jgi:hypothetical protein
MTEIRKVRFQGWRLFFFGMKCAVKGAVVKNKDVAEAYVDLANLAADCMKACTAGTRAKAIMIRKLDVLLETTPQKDELQAMLDGTHKNVPDWLRK